mgnify:CR=1 FL=1
MYEFKDKPIILASASASRQAMLQNANIHFSAQAALIDEESIKQSAIFEGMPLADCATLLAEMKGNKIAQKHTDAFIIASDQLLDLNNRCFSKPTLMEEAKIHLQELQGKTHKLHTSVVVFLNGIRVWHHLSSPNITLRSLSDLEIDTYLNEIGIAALTTPGCYQIEGPGAHLFTDMTGAYYDILGLPLLPLLSFSREHGLALQTSRQEL